MKSASLAFGKTKSGLPNIRIFRRHPVILYFLKILIISNSVSRLPLPRIRDITAERFSGVKTSAVIAQ
jgi:hypothetical protein